MAVDSTRLGNAIKTRIVDELFGGNADAFDANVAAFCTIIAEEILAELVANVAVSTTVAAGIAVAVTPATGVGATTAPGAGTGGIS